MYNFRYHLVTICSIFVALALGLLLGAALASSDVVRTTSDDIVEGVLVRYEALVDDNARLEQSLQDTTALAADLGVNWSNERLEGRTIALLLGNSTEDRSLQTNLSEAIVQAGGSTVSITVLDPDFGLTNEATRSALYAIVKEVPGEEYQKTLAKQLAEEWSAVDTNALASLEIVQGDLDVTRHTYVKPESPGTTDGATAQDSASGASSEADENAPVFSDDGLVPQTELQKLIYNQYPLTRALLAYEVISVDANYTPLTESTEPSLPASQEAVYALATAWQLPYGVNGVVNGLAQPQSTAVAQTHIGLQLTLSMQEKGTADKLVYPAWLKTSIPKSTSGDVALPNYFALLIQPSHLGGSLDVVASENGLSCITFPESLIGRYSIIALLSGAQAGIYGEDRSSENRFAPLPEDTSGRAVFK